MAKHRPFKKTKPGEPIPVIARQLESFMLEYNGKFNSHDYDKFERMELMKIARSRRDPRVKDLFTRNTSTALRRAPFGGAASAFL